jgi:diguanylate cyclase (GGDEF)-like protein
MNHIYIHEMMTSRVDSVDVSTCLSDVVSKMCEKTRSCMVVTEQINGRGHPVGIITERDMVRLLAEHLRERNATEDTIEGTTEATTDIHSISEYMSSPPICINQNAVLYEALVITQTRNIRHLPVVDSDENLVGILTQGDIARAHFRAIEKQRDIIEHQIKERTRELLEANEELKALSLQDSLLGIGNRRSMEVDVQFTHANASRYKRPYSIALLDVDCFKLYNDHYGHQAGDDALVQVTDAVKEVLRSSDRLYRYGGEELLLLLPETPVNDATYVVNRVLENLRAKNIPHSKSPHGRLTLSAGISSDCQGTKACWTDVVAEADEWLYAAKENGRDQLGYPAGPNVKLAIAKR